MLNLTFEKGKDGSAGVLHVEGELNMYVAAELKAGLIENLAAADALDVELSGVGEIDTSGLQLLLLCKAEAARMEKKVTFSAMSNAVTSLIELYHMDEVFN